MAVMQDLHKNNEMEMDRWMVTVLRLLSMQRVANKRNQYAKRQQPELNNASLIARNAL